MVRPRLEADELRNARARINHTCYFRFTDNARKITPSQRYIALFKKRREFVISYLLSTQYIAMY